MTQSTSRGATSTIQTRGEFMRVMRRISVASCVVLLVAVVAALPSASAGSGSAVAAKKKSACAKAKAKLRKDKKHHAKKRKLKKDRARVKKACKKSGGGGGGGGGTGGGTGNPGCSAGNASGAFYTDHYGYQLTVGCTADLFASFTVTSNKRVTGAEAKLVGSPGGTTPCTVTGTNSYSCTLSSQGRTAATDFSSPDACTPAGFSGTVTIKDTSGHKVTVPFTGTCR